MISRRPTIASLSCLLAAWFTADLFAGESERQVNAAVVQFDAKPEAVADNLAAMERLVRSAVREGARWVLFHEGSLCDYTGRLDELAEEIPGGPATNRLSKLAAELDCFISFGLSEKDGAARYITQVFVGPQGFIYRYRKTWLHKDPADKGFRDEYARYDPGTGPELFNFDGVKATCFICADGTSPRCIARAKSLTPEVVFYPLNVVAPDPTWVRELAARHAQTIGAPLLLANRVGASWVHEGGNGGAAVFSADGQILAGANVRGKEEIVVYRLTIPSR
jgi:predicted amidohydrolase